MPTSNTTAWVEQSTHATKRKRAGLVCVGCHERKIKCDLQARTEEGQSICSRCSTTEQECQLRPSKRGHHQTTTTGRSHSPQVADQLQSHVNVANELGSSLCTPPYSTATNDTMLNFSQQPEPVFMTRSIESYPFAQRSNYLYPQVPVVPTEPPVVTRSETNAGKSAEQGQPVKSPQSRRNNSEVYLGESGFLSVYSQEHRDYTNGQETGLGSEQRSVEMPGQDLMLIFTETYFSMCWAFCPVLDKDTSATDIGHSPLLASAMALVGSQVQPPMLPSIKPASYYSRAKQIFHSDEEADPLKCLQAVCLFYWWSPRPSTQIQRDAAWWWSAVGIRLAQQLGFHREPKAGPHNISVLDRGLQRRIWWTLFVSGWYLDLDNMFANDIVGSRTSDSNMSGSSVSD